MCGIKLKYNIKRRGITLFGIKLKYNIKRRGITLLGIKLKHNIKSLFSLCCVLVLYQTELFIFS
jgi:hypothetical protein